MKNKQGIRISAVLMVAAALLMTGCYASKEAKSVKFSGFLDPDYKLLQKGGPNEFMYKYFKPGTNFASYTKILLAPVTVLRPASAKGAESKDVQKVANNFYSQLVMELSKSYEMVKEPGPNTMRVQIALTRVSEGSGTMEAISSVVPIGIAESLVQDWVTGKPSFAGDVSAEGKMTDANTGELLAAAVDERIASKSLLTAVETWDALTKVTEIWSKMFAFRMCKVRGAADCVSPFGEK